MGGGVKSRRPKVYMEMDVRAHVSGRLSLSPIRMRQATPHHLTHTHLPPRQVVHRLVGRPQIHRLQQAGLHLSLYRPHRHQGSVSACRCIDYTATRVSVRRLPVVAVAQTTPHRHKGHTHRWRLPPPITIQAPPTHLWRADDPAHVGRQRVRLRLRQALCTHVTKHQKSANPQRVSACKCVNHHQKAANPQQRVSACTCVNHRNKQQIHNSVIVPPPELYTPQMKGRHPRAAARTRPTKTY